ncbi:hypothetical protein [Pseudomonas putida]|uniref:hypothetical protein n=1 Tax=Pseudomonas putida TaxID=303 RepID=UPI000305C7F6|nr:hypothetical protein [Pseudomonas putida]
MALKVFGGLKQVQGKQLRTIIAASSQKKAAELLEVSVSYLKDYFAVTGMAAEVEAALAIPGVVLQATGERSKEFLPITSLTGQTNEFR